MIKKLGAQKIQPVKLSSFKICSKCDELFNKGFMIEEEFYCKDCALSDFINFIKLRKESEK